MVRSAGSFFLSFFLSSRQAQTRFLTLKQEERKSALFQVVWLVSLSLSPTLFLSFFFYILLCFLICCLLSSCLTRCFLFPICGESYVTHAACNCVSLPSANLSLSPSLLSLSLSQNELKFNKLPILLFSFLRIFVVSIDIGHDLQSSCEKSITSSLSVFTFFAALRHLALSSARRE